MSMRNMNPAITSIYTADPSAHVWEDGRMYIYASHDTDPARGCDLMDRYHVFSSGDMVSWRDEGEILGSADVKWGRPEGGFMWAPDCAYKNGTYYFYYPHPSGSDWNHTWKIGVATSTEPARGFTDQGYIEGLGGFSMIDPAVFVDEDNRAYMYYGGGGTCEAGEMNGDMMSIRGSMQEMEGLEDFHEAAWVFKRNGVYYLTYADNLEGSNRMRYATSDQPLGPWTYRGIFLEPTGCPTTHGSVAEFKGQWYLFYHNQELSGEETLRSICIDELHFNPDGSIRTVVQTREGVKPAGEAPQPHPEMKVYAAADSEASGGAVIIAAEGVSAVAGLEAADACCQFHEVDGGVRGGRAEIRLQYAAAEPLSKLRLTVNGRDYSLVNAPSTGGTAVFTGCTGLTVKLEPGSGNLITWTAGRGDIRICRMTVSPLGD
ncbi:family 43 glycosylhydrolase [Paenibacillus sp. MMS20-IR301]|uniref:family 43 glycosylhydrolase n=1 Tax=Paenibacillus sp. MMS20-IR301 TaxID=2895946 RepID=UPI0028E5D3B4|nr:family 43 glycosylhydrolase [Paenibacillus sp. MMS20-IR301]WNS43343.1 family 43 glycosylhydrolase [Paenibacillus sp. MMS20-IR301]